MPASLLTATAPHLKGWPMSNAQDYRAKEAEYTRLAREATFISDIRKYIGRQNISALSPKARSS